MTFNASGPDRSKPVSQSRDQTESSDSFCSTFLRIALVAIPVLAVIAAVTFSHGEEQSEHPLIVFEPPETRSAPLTPHPSAVADGIQAATSAILAFGVALRMQLDRLNGWNQQLSISSNRGLDRAKIRQEVKALQRQRHQPRRDKQSRLLTKMELRLQEIEKKMPYLESDHPLQELARDIRKEIDDCRSWLEFPAESRPISKKKFDQLQQSLKSLDAQLPKSLDTATPSKYLHALLQIPAAFPIEDKLFQQVLGDYWGKFTGLEGYGSLKMLHHFLSSIKGQIAALEHTGLEVPEPLRSMQQLFEEGMELTKHFQSKKSFPSEFSNLLRKKQKGERCFFVGGWTTQSGRGGHAIVVEVIAQGDRRYSLRIFNRGAGQQYHGTKIIAGKLQALPFFEITDILEENITDPIFLNSLQEMQSAANGAAWSASDLYEGILPLLGKPANLIPYPPEAAREITNVGHCSYLSLEAFISDAMQEISPRFILHLQLKTFFDFFTQNRETLLNDIPKQDFLLKGAQALSRHAEKVFAEKKITLSEMQLINLQVSEAIRFLEQANRSLPAQTGWSEEPKINGTVTPTLYQTKDFSEQKKTAAPASAEVMQIGLPDFQPSLENFASDCQLWQQQFTKMIEGQHFIETREAIKNWARKIPIAWIQTPGLFTHVLSPEEAAEALEMLAEIAKDFLWADLNTHRGIYYTDIYDRTARMNTQDPETLFAMIKLLTFSDQLSKDFQDSTGVALPGLYQFDFDLLFEQAGSAQFFDPELEEQTSSLKAYWDQADPPERRAERQHLSFFGVEANPSFAGWRLHFEEPPHACKDTFRWPYLVWIEKNYLSRPSILKKIKNEYPHLLDLSSRMQALEALTPSDENTPSQKEKRNQILPKSYWALYDISWAANMLFAPPCEEIPPYVKRKKGFSAPMIQKTGRIDSAMAKEISEQCNVDARVEITYPFGENFESWLAASYSHYEIPTNLPQPEGAHSSIHRSHGRDVNQFIENTQDMPQSLRSVYGRNRRISRFGYETRSLERLRLGPHLRNQIPSTEESLQEPTQDLLALSSVRELQVVATLAYFTKHPMLLFHKDYQIFFINLISQPPLLFEELTNNPALSIQLASFVKIGYENSEELRHEQASEFFLDLNRYFSASVRHAAKKANISFPEVQFLDTRKELLKRIDERKGNPGEQSPYWLDLALLADPDFLTEESAADLLSAHIHLTIYPLPKDHPLYRISEQVKMRDWPVRFQAPLRKLLATPAKDRILNAVLKSIDPNLKAEDQWTPNPAFPDFCTSDGSICINAETGQLFHQNHAADVLPAWCREHPILKSFLPEGKTIQVEKNSQEQILRWTGPGSLKMRVHLKLKSNEAFPITIQKEIEPGVWGEYTSLKLWEIPEGLLGADLQIWIEQTDSPPQRVWIADSSGAILYRMQYVKDPASDSYFPKITKLLPSGEEWTLAPITEDSAVMEIEEANFILRWQDLDKKTISLEFPRYGLAFLDQGRGLQTEKIPGFSLQNKVHPAPRFLNSLRLEQAGKTRRRLFLNPLYKNSSIFQKSGKSFFLIEERKDKLQPACTEDRLFLCLLYLQEQQYDEALAMLSSDRSQLQVYTEEEKELLRWIINPSAGGNLKDKDFSLPNVAIRLRALYLLTRNEIDFQSPFLPLDSETLQHLTMLYLQHAEEIPISLRFSEEEELLLLTHLDANNPLLEQKSKQLRGQPIDWRSGPMFHSEIEPVKFDDEFFCFSSQELDKWDGVSDNQSLLRKKGLASQFVRFLKLASQTHPDQESYRTWYRALVGEDPDDRLTVQQLSQQIVKALTLIAKSRTRDDERRVAVILLAAMQYPESFQQPAASIEECLISHTCKCPKDRSLYRSMISPVQAIARTISSSLLVQLPSISEADPLPAKSISPELPPYALVEQSDFLPYDLSPPNGMILEEKSDSQQVSGDLIDLFAASFKDPSIHSHMSSLSQRLKSFAAEPRSRYSLQNRQMFADWKNSTLASIRDLEREASAVQTELLLTANKPFVDPVRRQLHKAELASGQKQPIRLQELLECYMHSHLALLIQKNPALEREEAEAILKKTHLFLLQATHLQHLRRLSNSIEEIESLSSPQEISLALEEIWTIAKTQRTYDPNHHPRQLVFEFFKNLLIWDKQISALKKLKQDGVALQEIMGGGKTSVILPLLALEDADGKTLSVVIMPEALIASVTNQLRPAFHFLLRQMEVVEVDRSTVLDEAHLERLHRRLEQAIVQRKIVIFSSTSFQSLILRCIEALDRDLPENEKRLWQRTFSLLVQSGSLKMDEMDLLLDVLKAHHFTQGEKFPLHTDLLDASIHFYKLLLSHPDLHGKIRWNFLQGRGGLHPLTEKTFDALRPLLIETLLSADLSPDQESKQFFANLSVPEKKWLTIYLRGSSDVEAQRFYESISSLRIKNLLSTWKEEIKSLLLLTGKKHVGEHYGQDPSASASNKKNPMAIPYHGNENPAIGSQPGTDLEILHYTIQMYLHHGLDLEPIEAEIKRIQEAVYQDMKHRKKTDIKKSPYYAEFLLLTGGRSDFQLFSLQPCQLEQIRNHVNQDPALLLDLVRRHILPQLESYPSELHTNAHVVEAFFHKKKIGFSGTFWNEKSYPRSFAHKELSNTEEKTLHLLWEQKTPVSTLPKRSSLKKQIETVYRTHRGSIADLGGIFRGFDSEEVAKTIIQLPFWKKTKIQGIAFYDSQGQRKILLKDTLTIIPFEGSGLAKEKIIAYWSQKYTTGSDIPLALDMTTVVTIGEHTIMRDLLQAVWRNRKLHRGQRVSIAILEQEADIIQKTLGQVGYPAKNPLSLADVFFYVKYNEALRQADYNLRGVRFNMENVLIARLFERFARTNTPEALKVPFQELFSQSKPKEPHLQYGALDTPLSGEEAAKLEITRLKQTAAFRFFSPSEQAEIEKIWQELLENVKNHLPQEVASSMHYGTEKAVQAEIGRQIEQETKKEAEIQTETQIENIKQVQFDRSISPKSIYLWKESLLFTKEYFSPKFDGNPPAEAMVIPDFERLERIDHPMDRLDVTGPDLLAQAGIRPLRHFEEWDSRLLISLNADPSQKMQTLLLIRDKKTEALQAMVLNDWDVLMFKRLLLKDKTNPQQGPREVELALYHTDLGLVCQGSDPIDPAIEQHPEFLSLKTKIKFLNGETDYSPEELPALKEWVQHKGPSKMKALFLNEIVKNKKESAKAYPGSPLESVFS